MKSNLLRLKVKSDMMVLEVGWAKPPIAHESPGKSNQNKTRNIEDSNSVVGVAEIRD